MHKFRRVSRKFCGLAAAAASQFMQDAQSHGQDGKQDAQTEEAHRVTEIDICIQYQADKPAQYGEYGCFQVHNLFLPFYH